MTSQGVLILDPPHGAPDVVKAWLVCIPAGEDAFLSASYTGNTNPLTPLDEHTELAICFANFEGHGFKKKITHCVVLSDMGMFDACAIVETVTERWPHVICSTMRRRATDGTTDEWPVAFAQRAIAHQEAATAVLVASRK